MALLELLKQQQAPRPMMGRANFGIQRPSPRVRLDKFKATLDPRMMEQETVVEDTPSGTIEGTVTEDVMPSGDGGGFVQKQPNSESQIANILAEISGIQGKDYGPRKKGGFKDILASLGIGALQGVASADPRGGIGAILGGALGGGAAGGIGGAVDGSTDNKMRDRMKLDRLYGEYGQASKVADAELNRKHKQTVIDNTIADNVARDKKNVDDLAEKRRNSFFRRYKNFDATKATAAQIKELAEFGETPESVGSFDFTKPTVQTIAGQKFLFNANTRSFEDAGLPKDGSKAIVDYTVIDPTTGVESKYSTTSERAAGLKTQLAAAGLQIQAAERRLASTQSFQAGENEKTRAHQLLMASHTAKLRDLSSQREALLRDGNNAASQKRAADIQKEMIQLRQEMKDSESSLPSGLSVVGGPIQQ